MAALALAQVFAVLAVMLPMMLYMMGVGIVLPQALAGAIGPLPQMAGSASALLGVVQMSVAAAAGVAAGHLHCARPHLAYTRYLVAGYRCVSPDSLACSAR